jgi:hypothetical protein
MSITLMTEVWKRETGILEHAVLLVMADQSNDAGFCAITLKELMTKTGYAKRSLIYVMKGLKAKGAVIQFARGRRGSTSIYSLALSALPLKPKWSDEDDMPDLDIDVDMETIGAILAPYFTSVNGSEGQEASSVEGSGIGANNAPNVINLNFQEEKEKEEEKKSTKRKEEEKEKELSPSILLSERSTTIGDNTNSAGARMTMNQVIDFYRVNIDPKMKPLVEDQLTHLCMTYGAEITWQALKESLLNNKHMGKPTFNFITAICMRLAAQERESQVRRAAIQGTQAPLSSEDTRPANDGLAKFREQIYGQGDQP